MLQPEGGAPFRSRKEKGRPEEERPAKRQAVPVS